MRYSFGFVYGWMLGMAAAGCGSVGVPDDGKRWGEPERIDMGAADALSPQVAVDAMGSAITVWDQTDNDHAPGDSSDRIWANRSDAEGGWGEAERLENDEPLDSVLAQVALDGEGNAVVVFLRLGNEDEYFGVWAVHYLAPTEAWGEPLRIESNDAGDASRPEVAVDPQGNAVVVWQQASGPQDDDEDQSIGIWSNRFIAGESWGEPVPVDDSVMTLLAPQVAIDGNGNAIAVWERVDEDNRSDIVSKHQTPTGDWTGEQRVERDDSGNAWLPQVASDAEGNAIAVWQQQVDGERFDIWANRYTPGEGWLVAQRIETEDAGDAVRPQVAMDADGNAVAVWSQLGGDRQGIWSNRYVVDRGWGSATPIAPTGLGESRSPQVASDPAGNAVAVWVQFDGRQDSVWSNRYTANSHWGEPEPIEFDDDFRAQGPQVAMDSDGDAVAVWSQENAQFNRDIWTNRLSSGNLNE